jgi:putative addiction module CopG family antidote
MQIELTPAQAAFIEIGIQSGRFHDQDDALRQMLAEWEQKERRRLELLNSIRSALQSVDAGEGEIYTAASLPGLVDSIEARGKRKLAGD